MREKAVRKIGRLVDFLRDAFARLLYDRLAVFSLPESGRAHLEGREDDPFALVVLPLGVGRGRLIVADDADRLQRPPQRLADQVAC